MKNFISVTAGKDSIEVDSVCNAFKNFGYSMKSNHLPALGFSVSDKSIERIEISLRYPKIDKINSLITKTTNRVLPIIHYHSNSIHTYNSALEILANTIQKNLFKTLQLGNDSHEWIPIKTIEKIKKLLPELNIILQITDLLITNKSNKDVGKIVKQYNGVIDAVQIDASCGNNKLINVNNSTNLYNSILYNSPELNIIFAGGLNGNNVSEIIKQINNVLGHYNFSIDAEGGLRKSFGKKGNDILEILKVNHYLKAAAAYKDK